MPTGVDECCSITLLFSDQRIAQINISTNCVMYGYTSIVGDKGLIQVILQERGSMFCRKISILILKDTGIFMVPDRNNLTKWTKAQRGIT